MSQKKLIQWTKIPKGTKYDLTHPKWLGTIKKRTRTIELRSHRYGCNILIVMQHRKRGRTRAQIKEGVIPTYVIAITRSQNGKSFVSLGEAEEHLEVLRQGHRKVQEILKVYQLEGKGFRKEAWLPREEYQAQGHR